MLTNLLDESIWLLLTMMVTMFTSSSMAADNFTATIPGCPSRCGQVTVPYPFGIGPSCSASPLYSLECDESSDPPRAFTEKINSSSTRYQVFEISESQILVNGMIAYSCPPTNETTTGNIISSKSLIYLPPADSPFTVTAEANEFSLAGSCDYLASVLAHETYAENLTCPLSCWGKAKSFEAGKCAISNGCCDRPIREKVEEGFTLSIVYLKDRVVPKHSKCAYAFIGMKGHLGVSYESDFSDPAFVSRARNDAGMAVDWVIGTQTCPEATQIPSTYACQQNTSCVNGTAGGYRCACLRGYQGNPYLSPGCSDINECAKGSNPCFKKAVCVNSEGSYKCNCPKGYHGDGHTNGSGCKPKSILTHLVFQLALGLSLGLLLILIIASGTYILIRSHKLAKKREKFFKQNGGLMLKEKLSSSSGASIYNTFKLFTLEQMKKATKNFSKDLVVGVGGYGIVYKGTLRDETVVAIKISKLVDNTQIEQFINEMVILTQIHHRNVVRLLGCCLEAEIPILVYEFVANGSLLEHIHGKSSWLTWNARLQIATEMATALGYLHSAVSTPIIHRDIKTANILIDENYVAKISDFGASRLIPMDKTQMSTLVQGTLGYMDPEYLLSSTLTDKSDVYSFGVVVAELLTGQKALSTERRMGDRNLAKYFFNAFKNGRILDIIDPRVVEEAPREQLMWVAEIVQDCLCVKGVNRPMMKDIAAELSGLERQTIGSTGGPSVDEYENSRNGETSREDWNNSRSNSVSDFTMIIEAR